MIVPTGQPKKEKETLHKTKYLEGTSCKRKIRCSIARKVVVDLFISSYLQLQWQIILFSQKREPIFAKYRDCKGKVRPRGKSICQYTQDVEEKQTDILRR